MDADARVTELELRFMEQAELLSKLNDALISQQRELDLLRKAVEHLSKKIDVMPGLVDAGAQEKPPHY